MQKICIVNQKGGVGKTTTAINLGYALACRGKRVLVMDLDPQGHATIGLGIERDRIRESMREVLLNGVPLSKVVLSTNYGVDVVPATIGLDRAEQLLISEMFREQRIRDKLEAEPLEYDYIIMDCRPTLGTLTINAINVSNIILIPCQFSRYALEGFSDLLDTMGTIKKSQPGDGWLYRVLLTMYDSRRSLTNAWVENQLKAFFDGGLMLRTWIRTNEAVNQASAAGAPVGAVAPRSSGAQDYEALAEEIQCL